MLVFDVDAMMEDYSALIFYGFGERDASLAHAMCSCRSQIKQLDALVVGGIDIIVQVEIKSRHGAGALTG